jgi:hypothetical protein
VSDNGGPKGLGGWLILVGLGVVIAPVKLLVTYVPVYVLIFEEGCWDALTTVCLEAHNPLLGPLLIGELAFYSIMGVALIYLVYLFFFKHYQFPKVYIGTLVILLIFRPFDAWLWAKVLPGEPIFDPKTAKEFMGALIGVAIWVPYMLISKRVKATFVENMPNKKMQPTAESVD